MNWGIGSHDYGSTEVQGQVISRWKLKDSGGMDQSKPRGHRSRKAGGIALARRLKGCMLEPKWPLMEVWSEAEHVSALGERGSRLLDLFSLDHGQLIVSTYTVRAGLPHLLHSHCYKYFVWKHFDTSLHNALSEF